MKSSVKKANFIQNFLGHAFAYVTVGSIIVVAVTAWLVWMQLDRYEKGVVDVCAIQQDAYVQLVLDQINLKSNRDDEEIVTQILGSLDASTNKYWTFSKDEAMLFVKDVSETNKYKGFTTSTYYVSESAKAFLDGLQLNRVTHQMIYIGDKSFVASGVLFEYGGSSYRLCLLTNQNVFLDNNRFLGSKIGLCVIFGVVAFIFLTLAMVLSHRVETVRKEERQLRSTVEYLNMSVNQLNERLMNQELYDTRQIVFRENMIRAFLERIQHKEVSGITLAMVDFKDDATRNIYLEKAQIMLDQSVIRFTLEDHRILLLFVQGTETVAKKALSTLQGEGARLVKMAQWDGKEDIDAFYNGFMEL